MHYMCMIAKTVKKYISFIVVLMLGWGAYGQNNGISAVQLAKSMNTEIFYESLTKTLTFSKNNNTVTSTVDSPILVFNGTAIRFTQPITMQNNEILLHENTAHIIEQFFYSNEKNEPKFKIATILIDPGHGGKDPGCVGGYTENGKKIKLYEKDITLNVATQLANLLKQTFPDKNIVMTRTSDKYTTLEQRAAISNGIKVAEDEAVIFISVHVNAAPNPKATGYEVWYLPRNYNRYDLANGKNISNEIKPIVNSMLEEEFSLESILMAKNIDAQLAKQIGSATPSRGIREEAYFVIRKSRMPAVLVELPFITTEKDAKLLNSKEFLTKCATGIYNGIVQFVSQFENYGF